MIATIATGLGVALIFGFLAARLRLPTILGYLLAGVAIGPNTPGFVADLQLSQQPAEIGVILLMFSVGLHFSLDDLLEVRRIALPGALAQIATATTLGAAVAMWWGWSLGAAVVFGLALSVASTVVLLRALEDRGVLESVNGRIAVGWLVVEDLAMVFTLVLLPPLAGWLDGGARGPFMQVANENILQFLARPEVPEAELTTKRALVAALRERVIPAWSGGAAGPAVLRGPACMSGPFQSQPA